MIHVRASGSYYNSDAETQENSTLHFSLVGLDTIKKFRELLNRSLNCSPEFGQDWFALADKVDSFIAKEETSSNP